LQPDAYQQHDRPHENDAGVTRNGAPARRPRASLDVSSERRRARRYPLQLSVEYKAHSGSHGLWIGHGETCDISNEGLLFTATSAVPLPFASTIELSIRWPAQDDDTRPLALQVTGAVLGSYPRGIVVLIGRAKFQRQKD
jgi:hypothetical protein